MTARVGAGCLLPGQGERAVNLAAPQPKSQPGDPTPRRGRRGSASHLQSTLQSAAALRLSRNQEHLRAVGRSCGLETRKVCSPQG